MGNIRYQFVNESNQQVAGARRNNFPRRSIETKHSAFSASNIRAFSSLACRTKISQFVEESSVGHRIAECTVENPKWFDGNKPEEIEIRIPCAGLK